MMYFRFEKAHSAAGWDCLGRTRVETGRLLRGWLQKSRQGWWPRLGWWQWRWQNMTRFCINNIQTIEQLLLMDWMWLLKRQGLRLWDQAVACGGIRSTDLNIQWRCQAAVGNKSTHAFGGRGLGQREIPTRIQTMCKTRRLGLPPWTSPIPSGLGS